MNLNQNGWMYTMRENPLDANAKIVLQDSESLDHYL